MRFIRLVTTSTSGHFLLCCGECCLGEDIASLQLHQVATPLPGLSKPLTVHLHPPSPAAGHLQHYHEYHCHQCHCDTPRCHARVWQPVLFSMSELWHNMTSRCASLIQTSSWGNRVGVLIYKYKPTTCRLSGSALHEQLEASLQFLKSSRMFDCCS